MATLAVTLPQTLSNGEETHRQNEQAFVHAIERSEKIHSTAKSSKSTLLQHSLEQQPNIALYVTPEHTLSIREAPIPSLSPFEALVHVRATGICGSDLQLWHRGNIGPLKVTCSSVLGHEAAGVVLAIGSNVGHLEVGDHVAIEPGVPCHECFLCRSGRYNLCESVAFAGVCPYPGTISRFITHPARYCHKMPVGMSFSRGALLEPLSVILHAISRCKDSLKIGEGALICGAGPIGLIALAVAKASGAWPLVITDVDRSRLEFARKFVPGVRSYLVQQDTSPLTCANDIRRELGCGERDIEMGFAAPQECLAPAFVLECTGIETSVITAAYGCRRGGTVMVVGVGRDTMNNLPFMHLSLNEIDLKFTNRYSNTWPAGVMALANQQVLNLDPLITHRFALERAVEAMEFSGTRREGCVKVQIVDDIEI